MRITPWSVLLVTIGIVSGAPQSHALDKPTTGPASAKVREEILQTAQVRLQQADDTAIRQAFSALTDLGSDAAAEALVARLRRGLPPQLIEAAIDSLVLLNRPVVGPALLELTQHRRIQIRIKAMEAIAALRQRSAQAALLYALDDPSSEVRSAAVDALASVGNARALPALLTAADRDVPGAWHAIGSLAGPNDWKAILARAEQSDVMIVRPALDVYVARKDVPVEARARAVQQVAALGSPSARACVADWLAAYPSNGPARLRQVLTDSLAKLDRGSPHEARDPKLAKSSVGMPVPPANAEGRAATLAKPAPAVTSKAQGAK